jgi:hypothetical protein
VTVTLPLSTIAEPLTLHFADLLTSIVYVTLERAP